VKISDLHHVFSGIMGNLSSISIFFKRKYIPLRYNEGVIQLYIFFGSHVILIIDLKIGQILKKNYVSKKYAYFSSFRNFNIKGSTSLPSFRFLALPPNFHAT